MLQFLKYFIISGTENKVAF